MPLHPIKRVCVLSTLGGPLSGFPQSLKTCTVPNSHESVMTPLRSEVNSVSRWGGKSDAIAAGRGLKPLSCEELTGFHLSSSFSRLNLPPQSIIKPQILLALTSLPRSAASLCPTQAKKNQGRTGVTDAGGVDLVGPSSLLGGDPLLVS